MLLRVPQENKLVDYLAYKLVHRLIAMIVYYIVALFNISFCVNVQGEKSHQSHERRWRCAQQGLYNRTTAFARYNHYKC